MSSASRLRKQKPNYVFSSSSESDSYSSDPDYSTTSSHRTIKRRNTRSCTRRKIETQTVDSSARWSARIRRRHHLKNSTAGASSSSSSSKENEEATPMKRTVLSWLIDSKQIQENEGVSYMGVNEQIVMATGRITRGRILCSCCGENINIWDFEKHAGSDLRRPYERIFLSRNHKPLINCLKEAWNTEKEMKRRQFYFFEPEKDAEDASDDACLVCADGGKLTCCGKCPNTVHSFCMEMEMDTVGDWLCPYCVCKYCGLRGDDIQSEQLITCPQCDKKFHRACLIEEKEKEGVNLNCWKSYCEQSCRKIHEKLESLVGVRNKLDDKYRWQIIRTTNDNNNDKLHHEMECNAKVALAWNLIDESFETITDRLTGIDVIQRVMYSCGSNLTRTNFRRFYTFIIEKEKEDEIICAACIRVHGRRIAEMPFISTAENYRRQGICGMLLAVLESILCSLKVEKLILPAVMEVQAMWKKYGFTELESELTREITSYNILTFPGLVRLHKDLRQHITGAPDYGNNHNDGPQRPLLDLNVEPPPEDGI